MIRSTALLLLTITAASADELERCFDFTSADKAAAACTEVIDRQPPAYAATRSLALLARSEFWWRHRLDHQHAMADANAALCAWPADPSAWRWRAKLFEEAGDRRRAADDRATAAMPFREREKRRLRECAGS